MTHVTNFLSLDLLRRDQILFTKNDSTTEIFDLYSLDSFIVRKDGNDKN